MRIGIVNDSAIARESLRRAVASVPEHQVAWLAVDGAQAVELAAVDRPDLILMDLIMPGLDGVEATRRIMTRWPCPIVIVTATISGHMGRVYEAMSLGAIDAVDTPGLGPAGDLAGASALLEKIRMVHKLVGRPERVELAPLPPARPEWSPRPACPLVALGASTGGPAALATVLSGLPARFEAAVVVIQHVDAAFAPGLARWLGEQSGRRVDLVQDGQIPEAGRVLLAATDDHLVVDDRLALRYTVEPSELHYRPSVDVFFASAAALWPEPGAAALLTGMGRDGASGLLALRRAGWATIAQDEASSVIWGMPRAAVELGSATRVVPLAEVATAIVEGVRDRTRRNSGAGTPRP
jgi:two-component system response regulator WspF